MSATTSLFEALNGHGVRLEPFRNEHVAGLAAALGHPEVFEGGWGGGPAAYATGDALKAWLPTYLPVDRAQVYVVLDEHRARVVGTSTLLDLEERTASAHLGYTAYDPAVWGTHVNAACKLLLLGRLFDHGFGRVKLQADVRNARSRAAILRLGARFEGIARRDVQRADGSWRDAAIHSIVVDEWPAVRSGLEARLEAARRAR